MNYRPLLISFLLFLTSIGYSQDKWELSKDRNGIKVYTSKEGTSKFKSIKVDAVLTGTLDKLMRLLTDPGSNKNWVYRTNNSYQIKRISPTEVLSYTETSLPWPASNRDVPLRIIFDYNEKNRTLKVLARGEPKAIPEKNGIVRIPYFSSLWDVKYDGRNTLRIQYFAEMDPGGLIPVWITNMFVAKGPFETFNSLAGLLKN